MHPQHEVVALNKGYRVTREGVVVGVKGCPLKLMVDGRGYYVFTYDKNASKISVHRFQAFQKFGEQLYGEGIIVRHLDGNPLNNHWDNIGIGTHTDNMQDRPPEARLAHAMLASSHLRKLTSEDVVAMREARASGMSLKDLSARYHMSKGAISDIVTGKQRRYDGGPITPKHEKVEQPPPKPRQYKLSPEDVVRMRELRAAGVRLQDLSVQYGVSEVMVSYIVLGKKYKDIGGPLTRKCLPSRKPKNP